MGNPRAFIPSHLLWCALLAVGSCRSAPSQSAPSAPSAQSAQSAQSLANAQGALRAATIVRTELFFGLGRKDAPDLSDRQWSEFVDQEIIPRFPDGLTILDAHGQWRRADGFVQREPARIVILVHQPQESDDAKIEQIRRLYCERFAQDSVLRLDAMQRVSF